MKRITKTSILILFAFFTLTKTFAGVTGKIQGKIMDADGNPLPGANVMLLGTNRGTSADAQGVYFILSVTPRTYDIKVQMMGYGTLTKTGIIVSPDRTTLQDFKLSLEAVSMEEVEVIASRAKVETDRTFSEYIVTSDDIKQSVMVKSVADVISLEPGMDIHGRGNIRGGDMNSIAADVVYYVDGIRMVSSDGLSLNNFTGVGKYDIESISIITGGLSAEYGNAQAGVINIVTKEGETDFHGNFEMTNTFPGLHHWGPDYYDSPTHRGHMKWDDPEWVNEVDSLDVVEINSATGDTTFRLVHEKVDYSQFWGQSMQGNLSGPLLGKYLSFYLGGRYTHDAINNISPLTHSPDNYNLTWKLAANLHPSIMLKVGGVYSNSRGLNAGASVGGIRGMGDSGKNVFLPMNDAAGGWTHSVNRMEYLALTHMITPMMFYELRLSNSITSQIPEEIPDYTTAYRKDKDDWFNLPRDVLSYNATERKRFGVKFDFSTQIGQHHFIKTGFDFIDYSAWALSYSDIKNSRSITYLGQGYSLPDSVILDTAMAGNLYHLFREDDLMRPVTPKQFAWYIQDKMEYAGLVINAGVRMDYFDPNIEYPKTAAMGASDYFFNTFTRFDYDRLREMNLLKKSEPKIVWAPRLGVAHSITDRSMIHFFYGHIYQLPSFYTMFATRWDNPGDPDEDINGNGYIDPTERYNRLEENFFGNPELEFEKTISFELGLDWNFYKDYVVSMSSYYKSSSNQATSPGAVQLQWWDPNKGMFDFQFTHMAGNGIHEDIQGIEFSLKKSFSDYFSFNIAYNLQWAMQGEAGMGSQFWVPDSAFVMDGNFWTAYSSNEDGSEEPSSMIPFWLVGYARSANNFLDSLRSLGMEMIPLDSTGLYRVEFWGGEEEEPKPDLDIRSFGKAQVFLATPKGFGPWGLFGDVTFNMIYRMSTGVPYLYSPIGKPAEWRNAPLATRTDLSLEKVLFKKKDIRATFYIEASNLFNQKDVINSGGFLSAYGPGEYVRWGMESPRPDNQDYLEYGDAYANSRWYGAPREIRIGFRSSF
ncbi:MAG: TonB-dependent receptor [Candidatus Marinimicrobia bacterium]|nr:TonB-dependent receptor [Candidatus Neomarinimicrobiota bacterium]